MDVIKASLKEKNADFISNLKIDDDKMSYITMSLVVSDLSWIKYFDDQSNIVIRVSTPSKHLKSNNRVSPISFPQQETPTPPEGASLSQSIISKELFSKIRSIRAILLNPTLPFHSLPLIQELTELTKQALFLIQPESVFFKENLQRELNALRDLSDKASQIVDKIGS